MIVKAFRIFLGKRMINDYWVESVFGIKYVEDIRIAYVSR